MAHKSKLTKPPQWWKHLRDYKKFFNRTERKNVKIDIKKQQGEK